MMDFDLFDMFGLSSEGFSFDEMTCDILEIGSCAKANAFNGEAAWQSVLLSPFGYEISLLVYPEDEAELEKIKKRAGKHGVSVCDHITDELKKCKVISVSGLFEEDSMSVEELESIFREGKENRALICVDPGKILHINKDKEKLAQLALYIDYLLPNEEEAAMLTGKEFPSEMSQDLLDLGVRNVIITRGKKGCYVRGTGAPFAMGAILAEMVDQTGVGANFTAGFIYGLFQDWQMKTCCEFASGCASASLSYHNATDGARDRKDKIKKILNNPYL